MSLLSIYSHLANRRGGFNKRGGQKFFQNLINGGLNKRGVRKSNFKTEKFTLIYSKNIIDKASR